MDQELNFKTCRYGHGVLKPVDGIWSMPSIVKTKNDDELSISINYNYTYSVKIYQCPACGYVEFFDDEVQDGS